MLWLIASVNDPPMILNLDSSDDTINSSNPGTFQYLSSLKWFIKSLWRSPWSCTWISSLFLFSLAAWYLRALDDKTRPQPFLNPWHQHRLCPGGCLAATDWLLDVVGVFCFLFFPVAFGIHENWSKSRKGPKNCQSPNKLTLDLTPSLADVGHALLHEEPQP